MTGGFFAILDDIAMLLDDAALMGKVAAKKTAGILGDDLAVNTEKATGFHASRELAVLWAVITSYSIHYTKLYEISCGRAAWRLRASSL